MDSAATEQIYLHLYLHIYMYMCVCVYISILEVPGNQATQFFTAPYLPITIQRHPNCMFTTTHKKQLQTAKVPKVKQRNGKAPGPVREDASPDDPTGNNELDNLSEEEYTRSSKKQWNLLEAKSLRCRRPSGFSGSPWLAATSSCFCPCC